VISEPVFLRAYEPFPGLHVNGKQTIDENIADLGGVAAAYDAFHASLHGQPAPMRDGFNGDQQFYIAFGQNWRSKAREAALRCQILTDGHSPAEYRADTVRNSDAWYKAFDVRPGQTLYLPPEDRVRIWQAGSRAFLKKRRVQRNPLHPILFRHAVCCSTSSRSSSSCRSSAVERGSATASTSSMRLA